MADEPLTDLATVSSTAGNAVRDYDLPEKSYSR